MIWLRKILFYILLAIYLVICPWIILNAFGYFFHPHSEQGLVKTGLIYLSTVPHSARVSVENKRFSRKTPAFIRDLLPGQYAIQITKKGYRSWTQTLPVEAGTATVEDEILLLPDQFQSKVLLDESFEDLIPLAGTHFIILVKGDKLEDFVVYDTNTHHTWPLCNPESPYSQATVLSYSQCENSSLFLVRVKSENTEMYLLFDSARRKGNHKDLSSLIHSAPDQIFWDARNQQHLFTLQSDFLNFISLSPPSLTTPYLQKILGFGLHKGKIIVLSENGRISRMDEDKKNEELLVDDPNLIKNLFKQGDFYSIVVLTKDVMFFLSEHGRLIANILPYTLIENGLRGYQIEPERKKILVWDKKKIGTISFPDRNSEDTLFQEGPQLHWAYTKGRSLEQAFWVFDQSYVLFRDHNTVWLLQLDPYVTAEPISLFDVQSNSSVYYSENSGDLFYLDVHSGKFCSVQIFPKHEIFQLAIPELDELKKLIRLKVNEF